MPFIRIALWIVLLVSAMLLPYLPGRYDPVAASLSGAATGGSFAGLLLLPVGIVWLASGRGYASAKTALVMAVLVAAVGSLMAAATSSLAAGAIVFAACLARLVHLWRRVKAAQSNGVLLPRAVPIALIVVPLAVLAARTMLLEPASAWSRDRSIANTAAILGDIEGFRERTGAYPVALNSLWPDYHPDSIGVERYRYEPSGQAYNLYFEHPAIELGAREIVMYNPRGEQDFSSHVADLLQLSPQAIRRQRGYFISHALPQARWKRFLFD